MGPLTPQAWHFPAPSVQATHELAAYVASSIEDVRVVALVGELGAGKTTFVQGLAHALGAARLQDVVSPTYTLVNEYPIRPHGPLRYLVHLDFYRLAGAESAESLGLEDQIYRSDAAIVVEWADLFPQLLPPDSVWLKFQFGEADQRRSIEVTGLAAPPVPL